MSIITHCKGGKYISKNEKLPSGTYYYVLSFPGADNPGKKEFVGYLYLQND